MTRHEGGLTRWPIDIVPPESAFARCPGGVGRLGEDITDCLLDGLVREGAERVVGAEPQVGHASAHVSRGRRRVHPDCLGLYGAQRSDASGVQRGRLARVVSGAAADGGRTAADRMRFRRVSEPTRALCEAVSEQESRDRTLMNNSTRKHLEFTVGRLHYSLQSRTMQAGPSNTQQGSQELVVLAGVVGSGKSTLSQAWQQHLPVSIPYRVRSNM